LDRRIKNQGRLRDPLQPSLLCLQAPAPTRRDRRRPQARHRPHPHDDRGAQPMSFPPYPKYKDSGVEWLGEVPEHWELTPVKSVAEVINGYPFDSTMFDAVNGFPLVRIRDLNQPYTEARYIGDFID